MAKRKRDIIHRGGEDKYSLLPHGQAYKPYILIQDVPSKERSSRPCGIKTGSSQNISDILATMSCRTMKDLKILV